MKNSKLLLLSVAFLVGFVVTCREGHALARTCAVANGTAKKVDDVVTTNASGVITSASNPWVVGDVGGTIYVTNAGGVVIAVTTISVFTSAGQITTTATANASTVGSFAVWAATSDTAQTAAINTQVTACKTAAGANFPVSGKFFGGEPGQVTVSGGYMVNGCIYDVNRSGAGGAVPSLIGSGKDNTVFFISPTITPCADGALLIYSSGQGLTLQGFGVDAGGILYAGAQPLIWVTNSGQALLQDIAILNEGSSNFNASALQVDTTTYSRANQIFVQNSPAGAHDTACRIAMTGTATEIFCSNHWRNLNITGGSSRTPVSSGLTWIGGGSDECGDSQLWCAFIAGEMQVIGSSFFGSVHLAAGSSLYIYDGNLGKFNSNDRVVALDIAPTAKVYATGTTFRGNAGAMSVNNRGTFIDALANDYKTCTSTVCTSRTAGQSFTGNLPITR